MNYFSQWPTLSFVRQDETRVSAAEALKDKDFVVFFFGAPWDRQYKEFIPKFRRFYDNLHEEKKFEAILVTRGDTEEEILSDFYNPEFTPATRKRKTYLLPCKPEMHKKLEEEAAAKAKKKDKEEEEEEEEEASPTAVEKGSELESSADCPAPFPMPRTGTHGNYLLLDPVDSEPVGTQLLFQFRVWAYPAVVVCYNRPAVDPPVDPKMVQPLRIRKSPLQAVEVRLPIVKDKSGRRKNTPFISDNRCRPDIACASGKWMLERQDPDGALFPWDQMPPGAPGALYMIVFVVLLTIASCIFTVMVARDPILKENVNRLLGFELFY
eukprot:gene805-446_t